MIKKFLSSIVEYGLHASTYKGIFNLLASSGIYVIEPSVEGKITALAIALVGVVQIFIDDHDVTKTISKE